MSNEFKHIPVMLKETIRFLAIKKHSIYVDGTLGGGGHTAIIASILKKKGGGKIIGIDQDPEAIRAAKNKLARYGNLIEFVHDNFMRLDIILNELGVGKVEGILLDLGVSSYQIENPDRGFSFRESEKYINAKIDMRMNPLQDLTAFEVINGYQENQLKDILFKFGEEPRAKNIAKKIIQQRNKNFIVTTGDLLKVIKTAVPFKKYQACVSRVFRGIRMEVNQELSAIESVIPQAIKRLKGRGRLVIISFHSLEDRIVKTMFRDMALSGDDKNPMVKLLTKKPLVPTEEEISDNLKASSAKFRAIEKI